MKSPPPRKLSDIHTRHDTRTIRTRQPALLLGERVLTSLVETSEDRPEEHNSTRVKTPSFITFIEAITTELESHLIDIPILLLPQLLLHDIRP